MAKWLSEEEKARRERIRVNDAWCKSGYIPNKGHRCDDEHRHMNNTDLSKRGFTKAEPLWGDR